MTNHEFLRGLFPEDDFSQARPATEADVAEIEEEIATLPWTEETAIPEDKLAHAALLTAVHDSAFKKIQARIQSSGK